MSEHGAVLQTYNQDLVKCLEQLKEQRRSIVEVIRQDEAEKALLEKNIKDLQDKLAQVNHNLQQRKGVLEQYNKTIQETELGFKKILETSQTLLQAAEYEAKRLGSSDDQTKLCYSHPKDASWH